MGYIAYNKAFNAYLSRTKGSAWILVSDRKSAYSTSLETLVNVSRNQYSYTKNDDWVFVADGDSVSVPSPHNALNRVDEDVEDTLASYWTANAPYANLLDAFKSLSNVISNERTAMLQQQLVELDRELVDLEHFIELNTMSAYEGYLNAKRMQTVLKQRRDVKQELALLDKINDCKSVYDMIDYVSNLNYVADKKYRCRTEYGKQLPWKLSRVNA